MVEAVRVGRGSVSVACGAAQGAASCRTMAAPAAAAEGGQQEAGRAAVAARPQPRARKDSSNSNGSRASTSSRKVTQHGPGLSALSATLNNYLFIVALHHSRQIAHSRLSSQALSQHRKASGVYSARILDEPAIPRVDGVGADRYPGPGARTAPKLWLWSKGCWQCLHTGSCHFEIPPLSTVILNPF